MGDEVAIVENRTNGQMAGAVIIAVGPPAAEMAMGVNRWIDQQDDVRRAKGGK